MFHELEGILRLTAVACALAAAGPVSASAAATTAQIERLIAEDKLDEAVSAGREAVRATPNDADLRMALAQALASKGRRVLPVVEAEVDPTAIGKKEQYLPFPELGRNTEVEVVYDPELLDDALSEVRKAIRLAPQRLDLRYSECFLLTDAGEVQKAAAAIFRTIESFPGRDGLAPNLASYGKELATRGDFEGAAKLLGVVSTAFPDDPAVLVAFGTVLAQNGQIEEGLAALDRAAEIDPRDASISRKRGVVSLLAQDFSRARSAFLRAHLLSHKVSDQFGAAAAQFGLDPKSARPDFEDLAEPAASADAAENELARDFLRAIVRPEERADLARRLVSEQQGLLAIPVLSQVVEGSESQEAAALMAEIYEEVAFPPPSGAE